MFVTDIAISCQPCGRLWIQWADFFLFEIMHHYRYSPEPLKGVTLFTGGKVPDDIPMKSLTCCFAVGQCIALLLQALNTIFHVNHIFCMFAAMEIQSSKQSSTRYVTLS